MLTVLGEMESSAQILDFLYLGSEWNAANLDELEENKITHILNVTKVCLSLFSNHKISSGNRQFPSRTIPIQEYSPL